MAIVTRPPEVAIYAAGERSVFVGGYEWVPEDKVDWANTPNPEDDGWADALDFLVTKRGPRAEKKGWRSYNVLTDYPGLHLTLAGTPPTREDVLEFANEYGQLMEGARTDLDSGQLAESLEMYADHINNLRVAVRLLDVVRGHRSSKAFVSEERRGFRYRGPSATGLIMPRSSANTPEAAARDFLTSLIDHQLCGLHVTFPPRLIWDPKQSSLKLTYPVRHLAGMLWLQLADAAATGRRFKKCGECGRWFELVTKVSERKLFCSQACRSKAYRERKASGQVFEVGYEPGEDEV